MLYVWQGYGYNFALTLIFDVIIGSFGTPKFPFNKLILAKFKTS